MGPERYQGLLQPYICDMHQEQLNQSSGLMRPRITLPGMKDEDSVVCGGVGLLSFSPQGHRMDGA
jgi:hypothetical protein